MKQLLFLSLIILSATFPTASAKEISLKIDKPYLNLPVSMQMPRARMSFSIAGRTRRSFDIRLAQGLADYWVFADVSAFKGQTLTIDYPGEGNGLSQIYQSDQPAGSENMYREAHRPQIHFTPKRGWHNDPNGLIYYEGEYHLFYQHNPYENAWGNMHWGHAVSRDLVHWTELPEALYPDSLGTMFSGSAVIDYRNTAGFNRGKTPAMVAIYTADGPEKEVQCLAYSLDRGRTWTKYAHNPVIDSKARWNDRNTRDPKVFWYAPGKHWVMVLFEKNGNSIYTSPNLKDWTYRSHTVGFWECPELFALPVDGNKKNMKWVMLGASGTYMLGSFDGETFTPEAGKYYYTTGTLYAAQTYNNIPASDGRRIQIGWGRVTHPDMPFNSEMLLPTRLTLRTTKEGVRLFSYPVKEIEQLQTPVVKRGQLSAEEADRLLRPYAHTDALRLKFTLCLSEATDAGLFLDGQALLRYDMNGNQVNGVFYSPNDRSSMELTVDLILDKTSVEGFIDGGAYSYSMERKAEGGHFGFGNRGGFRFWGTNLSIKNLEVYQMKSIWNDTNEQ
ncbi:MAG: 2,6-beta-D-fructofuranosidase [Tannerella sp.]|jgi:fructan beta-fructosidase|nr:2,6-beta-D-fructofuranosidase [Tannerella sp.]